MNWFQRAKLVLSAESEPLLRMRKGHRSAAARRLLRFEPLEPRLTLAAAGLVPVGSQPVGTLAGKIVYTSGGHGWDFLSGQWTTDRPNLNGMIESFGNQDQIAYYADYLLRAGATVVSMRPVGRQVNEVVLDNDLVSVTYTGAWTTSTTATRWYDEDYGAVADSQRYRFASTSATETATAIYTPNIPQAGFYPVYTWVTPGSNRTSQLYKINHTGGQFQIRVDHTKVGNGWVYLGTYHFNTGSSTTEGSVVISNEAPAGSVVIADAIRFGNGMGDLPRDSSGFGSGSTSGQPREDEASIFWIYRGFGQGADPASIVGTSNISAPSEMAQHMDVDSNPFGTSVYVGFHSNAGGGRGARGLIDSSAPTPNQSALASFLGNQINQDMQNLNGVFEYNWTTGTTATFTSSFGEINLGASADMDATIIEVAFHDSVEDAAIMRDPKGRDQIARSVYQGTLQYFATYGSPLATNTSLPSTPVNARAVSNASGEVTISWAAGPSSPDSVHGNAATGFRIYASSDGYGFDGGTFVSGGATTSATLSGYDPTLPYYFKVVAVNAGGESKASEVLTVLPSGGAKQVLIVNGFDRHDRLGNFQYTSLPPRSTGVSDRVWSRYNNSFDYVVQVHSAIHAAEPGLHVASTSNEAVISGAVNLTDYDAVVWIAGEESTANETFSSAEQTIVQQFITAGGHLFLSGSEIGWDLDRPSGPTTADRTFYETVLKADYVADDAGTYNLTPAAGSIFAGLATFSFSNGSTFSSLDGDYYDAEFPDVINPQPGAAAALSYSGGSGGTAAIQAQGTAGNGSIVMFGFPFETITNATRRQEIMDRVLDFFSVTAAMPAVDIKTQVNGQDADSPIGPILAAGGNATFTYLLTNPGNVALSSVVVTDDNGTPGNAADDFNPTFIGGDSNGNSQLDVGESWTYSAVRTIVAGQFTGTGAVSAQGGAQSVMDSDAANYFGAAPAVNVETLVGGQDADSPTGPILSTGGFAVFSYQVTNGGNIALSNVVVTDDNGTPGNAADDFAPNFTGGDTNGNSQLDLGETWTYSAIRTVSTGQYTGSGGVSANDSISQAVSNSDATNYFGAAPAVSIDSFINGDDADSPPGPSLTVGSTATFTYVVTNAGNIALSAVVVGDNNGTLDGMDDFNPMLIGGDTNGNNLLDTDETWTYSAMLVVVAGQRTHNATVTANDEELVETDSANYFGGQPENADFNDDGFVDGGDYIIWRKTSGTTVAAGTLGDANYDTQVDNIDYSIWQQQFGTSPGGGSGGGTIVAANNDVNRRGLAHFAAGTIAAMVAEQNVPVPLPSP